MKPVLRLLPAVAVAAVMAVSATRADVITDWNEIALDTIRATRTNPPRATRALAMMHVAMFDAVNSIERRYEPYLVLRGAGRPASVDAAAAEAAYAVLVDLYPDRQVELQDALLASLAEVRSVPARAVGGALGRFCAQRVLEARAHDGSADVVPYTPSGLFGAWQPTPPAFAPALLPNWPYVTPFAMTDGAQFRPGPPPAFDSPEYTAAFNEIKEKGRAVNSTRTADETQIAFFWEDGAGTATPPGHWMTIAQQLAGQFGNDVAENARLFALLAIAQADAAIVAWDAKYHYDLCRPVTAITIEAGDDGNPETEPDAAWSSLIPTPPFPTYTSGHSTFSGASARILGLFFGTDAIAFSAPSPDAWRWPDALTGVVRSWDSLSAAAEEAGQSRIYGGIHWQFDNQQGLATGRALADWVFGNFLQPRDPDANRGPRPWQRDARGDRP